LGLHLRLLELRGVGLDEVRAGDLLAVDHGDDLGNAVEVRLGHLRLTTLAAVTLALLALLPLLLVGRGSGVVAVTASGDTEHHDGGSRGAHEGPAHVRLLVDETAHATRRRRAARARSTRPGGGLLTGG